MRQVDRTKICWNCEADVSCEVTYCPFCGTDLLPASFEASSPSAKQDVNFSEKRLQESLASLYKPPYSVRNRQGLGVPDEREELSFTRTEPSKGNPLFHPYEQEGGQQKLIKQEELKKNETPKKGAILPLLFFMVGAHLFILGMLLLFCSRDGVVTLEWTSHFWFVYCLVGSPFLYFGVRMLKNDTEEY